MHFFAIGGKEKFIMTNNKTVLSWLEEMKALVTPDEVVWKMCIRDSSLLPAQV